MELSGGFNGQNLLAGLLGRTGRTMPSASNASQFGDWSIIYVAFSGSNNIANYPSNLPKYPISVAVELYRYE